MRTYYCLYYVPTVGTQLFHHRNARTETLRATRTLKITFFVKNYTILCHIIAIFAGLIIPDICDIIYALTVGASTLLGEAAQDLSNQAVTA